MHAEAYDFVHTTAMAAGGRFSTVLEIGGRNVNGSIRDLFPGSTYTALDIAEGDGVDIVADAATWTPTGEWDCVVSCETFEHTANWPQIVDVMAKATRPGGLVIITAATDPRAPHSAVDGGPLRPGEFYGNVDPAELAQTMHAAGLRGRVRVEPQGDVYASARKEA